MREQSCTTETMLVCLQEQGLGIQHKRVASPFRADAALPLEELRALNAFSVSRARSQLVPCAAVVRLRNS